MRAICTVIALCLCLMPGKASAEVRGYLKSFAVLQDNIDTDVLSLPRTAQSQNSLRVMWEAFGESSVWQVHYEASPVFSSRAQPVDSPTFNIVGDSYRLTDLEGELASMSGKHTVYQNLDRLNVQWQFEHGDLTVGRQAISFGSARIINPTDIFLPFNVQTFNTEYRTGVDAIRYQRPLSELGELDVGIVLGDGADAATSAAFLQLRGNTRGVDLQFALTRFAEQNLAGGGIQTALGDFGFWAEVAYVSGDESYLRASTGLDYAFTENVFAMVEYHHNGAGSDDETTYLTLGSTNAYQRGGVFLLGRDYLMPSVTVQLSPLWNLAAQAIVNLSDQSAFLSVSAEWNVAPDLYMDFGYYHFRGDEATTQTTPQGGIVPVLTSEYGTNPDTLYASLRFYF